MLTKKIQPEGQADESQRQGPLKLQECYNHPHHPHPPRGAMTTILPLLPAHLRRQVLAEQARLLEIARYTGKATAAEAGQSQVVFEGSRQRASRDGHGWQDSGAFLTPKLPSS